MLVVRDLHCPSLRLSTSFRLLAAECPGSPSQTLSLFQGCKRHRDTGADNFPRAPLHLLACITAQPCSCQCCHYEHHLPLHYDNNPSGRRNASKASIIIIGDNACRGGLRGTSVRCRRNNCGQSASASHIRRIPLATGCPKEVMINLPSHRTTTRLRHSPGSSSHSADLPTATSRPREVHMVKNENPRS